MEKRYALQQGASGVEYAILLLAIALVVIVCSALGGFAGLFSLFETRTSIIENIETARPQGMLSYYMIDERFPGGYDKLSPGSKKFLNKEMFGKGCAAAHYESWRMIRDGSFARKSEIQIEWDVICPTQDEIRQFGKPTTFGIAGFIWKCATGACEQGEPTFFQIAGIRLVGDAFEMGIAMKAPGWNPKWQPISNAGILNNPGQFTDCQVRKIEGQKFFPNESCDQYGFSIVNRGRIAPGPGMEKYQDHILYTSPQGAWLIPWEIAPTTDRAQRPNKELGPMPEFP